MKELTYSIKIHASKERIRTTLWSDKTFRDWSGLIDEGTYLVGEVVEGNIVQFISSVNGYGVTSLVKECIPFEYVKLLHEADTKETGRLSREKEWTGGAESYRLVTQGEDNYLIITSDMPDNLVDLFNQLLPNALNRIKVLAES